MSLHIGTSAEGEVILPLDAVTRTFAVLGQRGTGKTNAAVDLVEEMVSAGGHVAILDPVGVWYGITHAGTGPGLEGIVIGGEHGDIPLEETGGQLVAEFVVGRHYPVVVIDLKLLRKGAQLRFMADYCEALFHLNRDALHQVFEEADRAAPQQARSQDPVANRLLGAVEDIVKLGRSRGLGATLVTQRPATLNKNVLEVCENLLLFRLMGPNDRKAARAWVEANGDLDALKRVMDSIASLGLGQCWLYSPAWLRLLVQIQTRPRRTFDSSSTPEVGQRAAEPTERAPVDLDALREAMAASIEKVKANDPKALRERVAELDKQLTGSQNAASSESQKSEPVICDHEPIITQLQAQVEEYKSLQVINYRDTQDAKRSAERIASEMDRERKRIDAVADALNGAIAGRLDIYQILLEENDGITSNAEQGDGPARIASPARGRDQDVGGDNVTTGGEGRGRHTRGLGQQADGVREGARPGGMGAGEGRIGSARGRRDAGPAGLSGRRTEDMDDEALDALIDRKLAARGVIKIVYKPAPEVVRLEYLGAAVERFLAKLEPVSGDALQVYRYLMARGRTSIRQMAIIFDGADTNRPRWSAATKQLTDVGLVDSNDKGFAVAELAREAIAKALAPHDATDDEVDEVYQVALGRLVGAAD